MNPLATCAAAAALALASSAAVAYHHPGYGHRHYPRPIPRIYYPYVYPAPLFGYYVPRPAYVVPSLRPVYVDPYPRSAPSYPPPPPPRAQREPRERYAQIEPAKPARPSAPAQLAAAPTFERYTLSAKELFEFDKATLIMPQPKLDEIARALVDNPHIDNVTITGHTDRLGSEDYNQELSERRADIVKQYLVEHGVAANRLRAIGRGESQPVVQCNDTDRAALIKCLEPNRRVEVEQITIERAAPTQPARR